MQYLLMDKYIKGIFHLVMKDSELNFHAIDMFYVINKNIFLDLL